ncbi:MAG: sigma-70 family RNA polymerase sigma factor, partial [Akkermansiaceae bacterium]|nr:sigma-70 family RNA polymerase sigma factor [Akkermansiaceae bacterium]
TGSEEVAGEAIASLCEMYWYPLYALARRSGFGPHDAEDLTQGYFAEFLGKDFLASVAKEKGRLRSFLCVSFKHFISKQREHDRARKRGGGAILLSID